MARVMTPEQFRACGAGTLFAFGTRWAFGSLLILDEIVEGDGFWGFWATDPAWVDADDCGEAVQRLDAMEQGGASFPAHTSAAKYMSYDGDPMDVFLVLEESDWAAIEGRITFDIKERD